MISVASHHRFVQCLLWSVISVFPNLIRPLRPFLIMQLCRECHARHVACQPVPGPRVVGPPCFRRITRTQGRGTPCLQVSGPRLLGSLHFPDAILVPADVQARQ